MYKLRNKINMATLPQPTPHESEPGLQAYPYNVMPFQVPPQTDAPDPSTREGYIAFLQEIGEQPHEEALKIADVLHPKDKPPSGKRAVGAIATSGAQSRRPKKQRGSDWTDEKLKAIRIGLENGVIVQVNHTRPSDDV
jgi:hypothetical protein